MARTEAEGFEQIKDLSIPRFFFRRILAQGDIFLAIIAKLDDIIRLVGCDLIFISFMSRIIALCGFIGLGILNYNLRKHRHREDLRVNSALIDIFLRNLAARLGSFGVRTSDFLH